MKTFSSFSDLVAANASHGSNQNMLSNVVTNNEITIEELKELSALGWTTEEYASDFRCSFDEFMEYAEGLIKKEKSPVHKQVLQKALDLGKNISEKHHYLVNAILDIYPALKPLYS